MAELLFRDPKQKLDVRDTEISPCGNGANAEPGVVLANEFGVTLGQMTYCRVPFVVMVAAARHGRDRARQEASSA